MVERRARHLRKLETHRKNCPPGVLQSALRAFGFERVRQRGSHATWRHPTGLKIVVPIHRPVRRLYVDEAISLCRELMDPESDEGGEPE